MRVKGGRQFVARIGGAGHQESIELLKLVPAGLMHVERPD
jgi:hypothetical protein